MGNTIASANLTSASLDLANGNTKIKKTLTVDGVSTFNDNITLLNGKKINSLSFDANNNIILDSGKKINSLSFDANNNIVLDTDKTINSVDISALKKSVDGMAGAASGTYGTTAVSAASFSSTGAGTFGSIKTSDIDINGDITSTTGKSFVIGSTTNGLTLSNGQPSTATGYGKMTIDATTGNFNMNKKLTVGTSTANVEINPTGNVVLTGDLNVNKINAFTDISIGSAANPISGRLIRPTIMGARVLIDASNNMNPNTVTATGIINANAGLTVPTGQTLTASGNSNLSTLTATGKITANGGIDVGTTTAPKDLVVSGNTTHTGTTTLTGATTATARLSATGGFDIGSGKWLIEENVSTDVNKGTRLCFGKIDAQNNKTFFTCMNSQGNLEVF